MTHTDSEPRHIPADVWAKGEIYETYVGRWSRPVARQFVRWLTPAHGLRWLDIGCGTGALTQTILQAAAPAAVHGVDASAGFLALARQQVPDPRATFEPADAQALPGPDADFDVVVSGLVLNFVPDTARALAEMARVVRPGGVVAAYVWDYAGKMQFMRHFWNAAAALDPSAAALDEGRRFPLCQPPGLTAVWHGAGLHSVETLGIEIDTDFADFDDFWVPFTGGQGSAPTYAMTLSEERRAALRERLRQALPFAVDGSIPMVARAWAIRGLR